jgi:hypothetical protein
MVWTVAEERADDRFFAIIASRLNIDSVSKHSDGFTHTSLQAERSQLVDADPARKDDLLRCPAVAPARASAVRGVPRHDE